MHEQFLFGSDIIEANFTPNPCCISSKHTTAASVIHSMAEVFLFFFFFFFFLWPHSAPNLKLGHMETWLAHDENLWGLLLGCLGRNCNSLSWFSTKFFQVTTLIQGLRCQKNGYLLARPSFNVTCNKHGDHLENNNCMNYLSKNYYMVLDPDEKSSNGKLYHPHQQYPFILPLEICGDLY